MLKDDRKEKINYTKILKKIRVRTILIIRLNLNRKVAKKRANIFGN
jgi:hypothetical protein